MIFTQLSDAEKAKFYAAAEAGWAELESVIGKNLLDEAKRLK